MNRLIIPGLGLFLIIHFNSEAQKEPVIDIHLHAYEALQPGIPADWTGEPEAQALISPSNAEEHLRKVLAQMDEHNIVLAIASSRNVSALKTWHKAAPGRFIGGIQTNQGIPAASLDSLRILIKNGTVGVLGELGLQYFGVKPDDPRLEPYYTLAEEMQVPVCLHTGLGPPGGPHTFAPKFRTTLGRPSLFEPVLVRHPNMKAFLAHAGWPYISETIAMMYIYPDLYADIGVLAWVLPTKAFHSALNQLMDAGFGERLLFGSDQMMWPEAIGLSIKTIQETPFLTEQNKRDIFYNNAARFLELSEEEIEVHHGKGD